MSAKISVQKTGNAYDILEKFLEKTAHLLADQTETNSKNLCPVKSGKLKSTITQSMPDPETILVGTEGSEYAIFVEFGTIKQSPQPFMRNGLQNALDNLS
jgi:HK97 gp10 family phage protein